MSENTSNNRRDPLQTSIQLDIDKCIGCAHCMRVCPTEAIRIRDGKAIVDESRCIDCAECIRACPIHAYDVKEDNLDEILDYKYRVAIVPSVFFGQFPEKVKNSQVHKALRDLGFTHVYEIEGGIEILRDKINELIRNPNIPKPIISSFCPSIVRLIQLRFPAMIENIAHLRTPTDLAAMYYTEKLKDKGAKREEIGMFYVTQCPAKKTAINTPMTETQPAIDGVININIVYNKVYRQILRGELVDSETEKWRDDVLVNDRAIRWMLTGGESNTVAGRTLAIDGMTNAIKFLEKMENEELNGIDFLEIRACDESCAGGVLNSENRFLAVERLKTRAREVKYRLKHDPSASRKTYSSKKDFLMQHIALDQAIEARQLTLDEDRATALKKIKRKRELMCFLPGIDCGACGSPNCQALAEDIVNRKAAISNCIFLQKQMEHQNGLSAETSYRIVEKVWGKARLEKDCSKAGAKFDTL